MSFALNKFQQELSALFFTFNQHYQKLAWAALVANGAVEFIPFTAWVNEDASRRERLAKLNAIEDEASAAAAKPDLPAVIALSKEYYNGLFLLWRDYDKDVEAAFRVSNRKAVEEREALRNAVPPAVRAPRTRASRELAGVGA